MARWAAIPTTDGTGTNDLDQDRSHNDANEITDIDASSTHVAHDAAGNMTKVPKPASWSAHYDLTWDAWNRLVKVVDGANTVAEYQYDGSNRRIVKKLYSGGSLDETRHMYLSLSNQVLEERVDSSTSADRQFTWGARYVDDLVFRTRDTDGNGSLDETLYAMQDANWNITALTDSSGTVTERFVYNAYGKSTVLDADFTTDGDGLSDYAWEYRFTSREFDSETGLHYFRARYYHDGIGRFIGRDRRQYIDGANAYATYFVPNRTDASGNQTAPKTWPSISGNACIFSMDSTNGHSTYDTCRWESECPLLQNWIKATGTSAHYYRRAVYKESILKRIKQHKCCSVHFVGHQGGSQNAGGVTTYPQTGNDKGMSVHILPDPDFEEKLKQHFKENCGGKCDINIYACNHQDPIAGDATRTSIAERTGCDVFGADSRKGPLVGTAIGACTGKPNQDHHYYTLVPAVGPYTLSTTCAGSVPMTWYPKPSF